ncbi:MAG: L-glyceraldehyde 3-phosphate reductase [Candidatus Marinimicrobia bacterium]|nr:L-glyceraldehyde 3-phosphate reductase [Candidatus Neomarinimicrobiota bacterium]
MTYTAAESRYDTMAYRRCGDSGIHLPAVSLGLWHNFGNVDALDNMRAIIHRAFDLGITHFDLANNYGPPPGSAEKNFGKILQEDLARYRDELLISSKAGYWMWPGPYGDWGSRKYIIASCNQSLKRLGLDYMDIFYHHRPDPETPLEESMMALDQIVRQGKALYAGISNYPADKTRQAAEILESLGTPFLIHQPRYNMFDRWIEDDLLDALEETGTGSIVFSPLAQGILTDKYLVEIPEGSRASREETFLQRSDITEEKLRKVAALNDLAKKRNQSLAQMAIVWILRHPQVTSVLVGSSSVEQIEENVEALDNPDFSENELEQIEEILA